MACRSRTAETYARISCASLKALACASSRTNSRLLQPLKSLTFKATPLCLLASFLFDNFGFPLDHPFTMVLGAGTAHSLTVNYDRNRNVSEPSLQWMSVNVGPRFDRLISAAQGHQLATHRTAHALRLRRRCLQGDSVDRESDAVVADMRDECAGLSAIDRYGDVQPIKRAQEAVEDPEPTFLEASFEHGVVKSRIPRLGLPRSSMLVGIQQFLDARVRAPKVACPTHCADLLA